MTVRVLRATALEKTGSLTHTGRPKLAVVYTEESEDNTSLIHWTWKGQFCTAIFAT
jgi:hypothetical protein